MTDLAVPEPIGKSAAMQDVFRLIEKSATSDSAVLLHGEIGTGKDWVARTLHQSSRRTGQPWKKIHCSSLTEEQLETELLGKPSTQSGDEARFGTLYLDEIHALPGRLQSRLLNFIDQPQLPFRLIASTNIDIQQAVVDGLFREDLLWRLNVLPIVLPPLRRRERDAVLFVEYFAKQFAEIHGLQIPTIRPDAMKVLSEYPWPGNLRELRNYIERAVIWSDAGQIELKDLPPAVVGDSKAAQTAVFRPTDEQSLIREYVVHRISKAQEDSESLYRDILDPLERELLCQIMEACDQTQTRAATRLGINRNTLYKKLVDHGLVKNVPES